VAQERFERGEFVVHRDAQRLEDAADGEFSLFFLQAGQGGADGVASALWCDCFPASTDDSLGRVRSSGSDQHSCRWL